jgi:hypothetical protein
MGLCAGTPIAGIQFQTSVHSKSQFNFGTVGPAAPSRISEDLLGRAGCRLLLLRRRGEPRRSTLAVAPKRRVKLCPRS